MFPCQLCGLVCSTPVAYVNHMRIHSHSPNLLLHCCIQDCNRTFKKIAALKAHLYRRHKACVLVPRSHVCPSELACHVDLCSAKCDTLTQFYSHLKVHIKEGRTVTCPFRQCNKSFTVLSTFTSHLSRKHKHSALVNLAESIYARELLTEAETFQNIAIFYTFNVEYQAEAACTLEFIQRRFIGINPEKGTKGGRVLSKRTGKVPQNKKTVNTRVSSLLKKLMDFEWDFI